MPISFIEPCLPSPADKPPSGSNWIHEIKHDGFRLMARRDPVGIRLITRKGNDWTTRFPLVVEAVNHLKVRSCLIDGEVVCCDEKGVAAFQLLRHRRNEPETFLYAFDLLELNGTDLRREPIEVRKATLASILRKSRHGLRLNEHLGARLRSDGLPARLQDGAGGDRLEAPGIALQVWPVPRLAEVQEPGRACGEAGGRGELGMSRFICRFAVGRDGLAYSGVWRVWTAKNKPDLYISIRTLGGELKATVHAPHPPHQGWKRHFGFPMEAASLVSQEAKRHGGPHKLSWTGCHIGPETTVEYRVSIRGTSLEEIGQPVGKDVALLPIPSPDEYVEVVVILGPTGPTSGYPRERDGGTILLDEGRLSDGRAVWVVYIVRPAQKNETKTPAERSQITPESSFIDPNADLNSGTLRAVGFGTPPDGSLVLYDFKATFRATS